MFRCQTQTLWLISLSAVLSLSADLAWKSRNINQWKEEDVRQILNESPWAKTSIEIVSRLETEDERRAGGKMGQGHGVGFDGVDGKGSTPTIPQAIQGQADTRRTSHPIRLKVRSESALPMRAAAMKAGAPTVEGGSYSIGVYGVPGIYFDKDPKSLGNPLKNAAALRRAGKMDVKPSSVEVFQREEGLAVVYQFPLSAEITKKDGIVEFEARIGRISVVQRFNTEEMQFQGNLEL